MSIISILLDIPSDFVPYAKYVFNFLSNSWGLPVDIIHDKNLEPPFHIQYGFRTQSISCDKALFIAFEASLYDPLTHCSLVGDSGLTRRGDAGTDVGVDLIAAIFRLLTMADEQQIDLASRDRLGNFFVNALPEERRGSIDLPIVDYYASVLLDKLFSLSPELRSSIVPRWPQGKKFAACLTHDCDLMHMGHPYELATAIVKGFVRRNRVFF